MKNPMLFLAINDYMCRVIRDSYVKYKGVQGEGPDAGFIYYEVGNKLYKIPPITNAQEVVMNTIAGQLISEGYTVVNALDDTFVVSNNKGDTYFVNGNSCSCADRFNPCKHMLFRDWYQGFRRKQINLLHMTRD